jgi:hypothetical protein
MTSAPLSRGNLRITDRLKASQEFTAEALRTQRKNYGAKPMPVHSLPMVIIERGNERE